MEQRTLGRQGLAVAELGLGCMGMSQSYGPGDDQESVATIHRALELGMTFLDTADMYGPFTNERLVGRAIAGRRDEALATKFGNQRRLDGSWVRANGEPDHAARRACDESLASARVDHIDPSHRTHRLAWSAPAEDTWGSMAEPLARLQRSVPGTGRRCWRMRVLGPCRSNPVSTSVLGRPKWSLFTL